MELIPGLPDEIGLECLIRIPYKQFSKVSQVSKIWKSETDSQTFNRIRKERGLIQFIIALIQAQPPITSSGTSKNPNFTTSTISTPVYQISLYESGSNHWEKVPPIPDYPGGLPLFCRCIGVGRNLVVIGGWDNKTYTVKNSVFIYDLVTGIWRSGRSIPGEIRSFFACASDFDRTVYIAGGHDVNKFALRSAFAYDVVKDEWIQLPDMTVHRDEPKGLFQGGKFHVISGYQTNTQGKFEKSAEAFDVHTWKWVNDVDAKWIIDTCPRTCVVDADGIRYRCQSAYLECLDVRATWLRVTELPPDVHSGTYLVTWDKKMLVIGSPFIGGPNNYYELVIDKDNNSSTWTKIEAPIEFTGHVLTGCTFVL